MNSTLAIFILVFIFGLGDIISVKTQAAMSMILFVAIALLVGFWTNILPTTVFADSNLMVLAPFAASMMIVSLGSLFNLQQLKEQWKTAVIAFMAVLSLSLALFFIGAPIIGKQMAIASAPVLSGGGAAALIMSTALNEKGFPDIAVFVVLLYVTQKFIGLPIAAHLLKKESRNVIQKYRLGEWHSVEQPKESPEKTPEKTKKSIKIFPALPKDMQTPFVLLTKIMIVILIGDQLFALFQGKLNVFVIYLILGVIFTELGFLEYNIINKANSNGLVMLLAMTLIFSNLSKATPEMALMFIKPLLVAAAVGITGNILMCLLMSKIFKYSTSMAVSIGMACTFGFPPTYFLSHEVSNAIGETEEEKEVLLQHILPKMLVAGFVTVSISSVIFAGVMANLL